LPAFHSDAQTWVSCRRGQRGQAVIGGWTRTYSEWDADGDDQEVSAREAGDEYVGHRVTFKELDHRHQNKQIACKMTTSRLSNYSNRWVTGQANDENDHVGTEEDDPVAIRLQEEVGSVILGQFISEQDFIVVGLTGDLFITVIT
jgi:hypothetical protein